jgi:hypothetical protein
MQHRLPTRCTPELHFQQSFFLRKINFATYKTKSPTKEKELTQQQITIRDQKYILHTNLFIHCFCALFYVLHIVIIADNESFIANLSWNNI